ncbi:DUF2800 domain-containing protein [Clostridium sp. 'deep sea']|uniref:DUF2800 domain-containing protein n=1 Tax=Clostridium sp. 'deep sea' TaxID=2779445 RepID=UPI0018968966|nr:DUF2800 domain-containing protein [Clostridium sp. 'deep sea']QOR34421.1 DUF2800 domain-containing protein [Clostridium sp. 'deep sea']
MAHALLSASGSSRWIACPPSARLEEKEQDTTSEYAREGTLAHEIGELALRFYVGEITKRTHTLRLNKLKKHELFAPDMLTYVQVYVDYVIERYLLAKKKTPDAQLIIEQRLDFSEYVPDGFGTGDALIIADNGIEVIDLKYGKGVQVSAESNSQMMLYGLGALSEYEMLYDIQEAHLTIVQPRLENISEFTIKTDTLIGWGELIRETAKLAYNGEGEFKAGSHCRFCKIKAKCKAYADEQLKLAKYEFRDPAFLVEKEIADILSRASDFDKWLKAVKAFALDQAVNHEVEYPGYKLVEGRSNRQYVDEDKAVVKLIMNGFEGKDLYKPKEVLGITAMEKHVGKKKFNTLLADLVIKPQGKPSLVPVSDKRPEWRSEDDAVKDFQDLIG